MYVHDKLKNQLIQCVPVSVVCFQIRMNQRSGKEGYIVHEVERRVI